MDEIYKELFEWLSRPPSGYGNHCCDDCTSKPKCPLVKFSPDTSKPISCSYYWPPNAGREPKHGYWAALDRVANDYCEPKIMTDLPSAQHNDKDEVAAKYSEIPSEEWITCMKQLLSNDRSLLERIRSNEIDEGAE